MLLGKIKRSLAHFWPVSHFIWYRLPRSAGRAVALTFDDGPHPVYTPQVLDLLNGAGMKGVFFVLGNACRQYPELVRRIVDEGHTVGIHGMNHSPHRMVQQVEECRRLLLAMGVDTRLFRPPRGQLGVGTFLKLTLQGYRIMIWSVDTKDSLRYERKVDAVEADYSALQAGDIVLMHDDHPVCARELPGLMEIVRGRGWRVGS